MGEILTALLALVIYFIGLRILIRAVFPKFRYPKVRGLSKPLKKGCKGLFKSLERQRDRRGALFAGFHLFLVLSLPLTLLSYEYGGFALGLALTCWMLSRWQFSRRRRKLPGRQRR
jgi:hypothetical protein